MKYSKWLYDPNFEIPKSTALRKRRQDLGKVSKNKKKLKPQVLIPAPEQGTDLFTFNNSNHQNNDISSIDEKNNESSVLNDILFMDDDGQEIIDVNDEKNLNLLCCSLLTLFFRENITQSALKTIIEHTQLFTKLKIPKSLNQLFALLTDPKDKVEYSRVWYCKNCKLKVQLNNPKQRFCKDCNQRWV